MSRSFSARQRIRQQVLTERNAKPVAEQRCSVEMQREDVANRFVVAPVLWVTPERVTRVYIVRHVKKRDKLSSGERKRSSAQEIKDFAPRRTGDNELIIVHIVEIATEEAIDRGFFFRRNTRELISG